MNCLPKKPHNKNWWALVICILLILIATIVYDSTMEIGKYRWVSSYKYKISVILTVDSIMTGASVSFLVFSYFSNNSSKDNMRTKVLWTNYLPLLKKKPKDMADLNNIESYSFYRFSPIYAITFSIAATVGEVFCMLFNLYLSAPIFELITVLLTLSMLWRFNNLRNNPNWNILNYIMRAEHIAFDPDKITPEKINKYFSDDSRSEFISYFQREKCSFSKNMIAKKGTGEGKKEDEDGQGAGSPIKSPKISVDDKVIKDKVANDATNSGTKKTLEPASKEAALTIEPKKRKVNND